jgi:plastocyanin
MKITPVRSLSLCLMMGTLLGSALSHGKQKESRHQVKIRDMVFVPPLVKAKPGDEVTWTNEDIYPHTVTSQHFDSGEIAPGKTWTMTIKEGDMIAYKCSYHPTMIARIMASGTKDTGSVP